MTGTMRTDRDCLGYRAGWHIAHLQGSDLYVRQIDSLTEKLASRVGSFAFSATDAGMIIVYVSGGSLYSRIKTDSSWGVPVLLAEKVGPLPSCYCWSTPDGFWAGVAWHGADGGVWVARYEENTWQNAVCLDSAPGAQYPALTGDGICNLWAAWEEEPSSPGSSTIKLAVFDGCFWVRWPETVTGDDPSLGFDGKKLNLGYQDRWSTFIREINYKTHEIGAAVKLGSTALFTGIDADPLTGQAAVVWSHWEDQSPDMTDYGSRTVKAAIREDTQWQEISVTEDFDQGQPGIAHGPDGSWGIGWTNHQTNQVMFTILTKTETGYSMGGLKFGPG